MSIAFMAINCTECNVGYAYNWSNGACASCVSNCASCMCQGDTCWDTYCETCGLGYVLNDTVNPPVCQLNSTSTAALQSEGSTSGSSSGAVIGLAVWGAVMTVTAVVFLVLYLKKNTKSGTLLGSVEPQASRQVVF